MQEKRKYIRTAFSANIKLTHADIGSLELKMRDMSDGGVFVIPDARVDLPVGATVEIQATDIEDAPVLKARIMRREAEGIGLMFIDL